MTDDVLIAALRAAGFEVECRDGERLHVAGDIEDFLLLAEASWASLMGHRRAAITLAKQAAALCNAACGELADCDDDDVRPYRPRLLKYRSGLNNIAAALKGDGRGG